MDISVVVSVARRLISFTSFREDVINLSPALVVINAGTNDVAENTGAYNEDYTFGNIASMAELAKANKSK